MVRLNAFKREKIKKEISKQWFNMALRSELKQLKDDIDVNWGEKRLIRKYIEITMTKMYEVQ